MKVETLAKIYKRIKKKDSLSVLQKARENVEDAINSESLPSKNLLLGIKVETLTLNELEIVLSLIEARISDLA